MFVELNLRKSPNQAKQLQFGAKSLHCDCLHWHRHFHCWNIPIICSFFKITFPMHKYLLPPSPVSHPPQGLDTERCVKERHELSVDRWQYLHSLHICCVCTIVSSPDKTDFGKCTQDKQTEIRMLHKLPLEFIIALNRFLDPLHIKIQQIFFPEVWRF